MKLHSNKGTVSVDELEFVTYPGECELDDDDIKIAVVKGKKDGRRVGGYEYHAHIEAPVILRRSIELTGEQVKYFMRNGFDV